MKSSKIQSSLMGLGGIIAVAIVLLIGPACGHNASPESQTPPTNFNFNPGGNNFQITNIVLNLFPTGAFPNRIEIVGNNAFVVNSGSDNIEKIDLATHTVTNSFATVPIGSNPWDVAIVGTTGFVSNFALSTVAVVDMANGGPASKIITPNASGRLLAPEAIVAASNGLVFVTNTNIDFGGGTVTFHPGFVTVIDSVTQTIVNEIPTTQLNPQFASVRGNLVYVVNSGADTFDLGCSCFIPTTDGGVDIIDATTARTATAPQSNILIPLDASFPQRGLPGSLAISADGSKGYLGSNSGILFKVDLNAKTLLRGTSNPIDVTPSNADNLVTVKSDSAGVFWVLSFNEDVVYLLDPATDKVSATKISVDADTNSLEGPLDIAFRSSGTFPDAYVLMSVSDEVSAIITN